MSYRLTLTCLSTTTLNLSQIIKMSQNHTAFTITSLLPIFTSHPSIARNFIMMKATHHCPTYRIRIAKFQPVAMQVKTTSTCPTTGTMASKAQCRGNLKITIITTTKSSRELRRHSILTSTSNEKTDYSIYIAIDIDLQLVNYLFS